jgi:hypothetical protein
MRVTIGHQAPKFMIRAEFRFILAAMHAEPHPFEPQSKFLTGAWRTAIDVSENETGRLQYAPHREHVVAREPEMEDE